MAFTTDDMAVQHQLFVGDGSPTALGIGILKTPGASYLQGPNILGDPSVFPNVWAGTMIGPLANGFALPPIPVIPGVIPSCIPVNNSPYSLAVVGDAAIFDNCDVNMNITNGGNINSGGNMIAAGEVMSQCGGHILSNKKNLPFDMKHPTKPGWRLRHVCLEGPEIGVYIHGKNKGNILKMPDYWRGLVKQETITVHLTPIGGPYILYVEKIEDNKVYVGSNVEEEVEYNYVLHASRFDDDLIVEYQGLSHLDYPGGNEGYSFSFENDNMERIVKEVVRERLNQMENKNGN